jgi:hypothetical protein
MIGLAHAFLEAAWELIAFQAVVVGSAPPRWGKRETHDELDLGFGWLITFETILTWEHHKS